jgi:hypothetical protein
MRSVLRLAQLLTISVAASACYSILGPDVTLPPDAVPGDPLEVYAEWYADVEACTGVEGDFDQIRWFRVPHERWWDPVWKQYAIGTWRAPHDIYLAEPRIDDEQVVKHEMVHDVLGGGLTYDDRFLDCSGIAH